MKCTGSGLACFNVLFWNSPRGATENPEHMLICHGIWMQQTHSSSQKPLERSYYYSCFLSYSLFIHRGKQEL